VHGNNGQCGGVHRGFGFEARKLKTEYTIQLVMYVGTMMIRSSVWEGGVGVARFLFVKLTK
jgi:hypothetical protein